MLAPDFTVAEINCSHAARGDQRAGECACHAVDEHRARSEFRSGERCADDRIVADLEGHRDVRATRVIEAVGAYAEIALTKIQRKALGLGPVVTPGVKAKVSAADQAVHALRGGLFREHSGREESGQCKSEVANG